MSSFEKNKIFAAILCAVLVVMLSGFFAKKIIHPKELEKDAVTIEGAPVVASSGTAKPDLPDPIMAMLATADKERGAKLSKACTACHSFEKGGPVKQGPNLWAIVGAPKAAQSGYSYSDALKEKGGDWNYASLNFFMWKPKKYIAGTKMNFAGLKKASDRAALIMWLHDQGSNNYALPTAAEIAAEEAPFAVEEEPAEDVTATETAPVVIETANDPETVE